MHRGIPTVEGCGNPSRIGSIMEKTKEVNQKFGKIGWTINQTFAFGLEHDKIWAQWASISC